MIDIEYIVNLLKEEFPEQDFIASDRILYKVILINKKTELRISNKDLQTYDAGNSTWLQSIIKAVASNIPKENYLPTYKIQMEKDLEED